MKSRFKRFAYHFSVLDLGGEFWILGVFLTGLEHKIMGILEFYNRFRIYLWLILTSLEDVLGRW